MAIRTKGGHSLSTYYLLNNKRDLAGRTLTDQQKLDLNPYHIFWDDRAQQTALHIRHRIGDEAFFELQDYLPDVMDGWSPQQWYFAFDRIEQLLDQAGLNNTPSPIEMAIIAAAGPVSIHLYEQHKHLKLCPECKGNTTPAILDGQGYLYKCDCGNIWRHTDQAAKERWEEHIQNVKERYFSHLTSE